MLVSAKPREIMQKPLAEPSLTILRDYPIDLDADGVYDGVLIETELKTTTAGPVELTGTFANVRDEKTAILQEGVDFMIYKDYIVLIKVADDKTIGVMVNGEYERTMSLGEEIFFERSRTTDHNAYIVLDKITKVEGQPTEISFRYTIEDKIRPIQVSFERKTGAAEGGRVDLYIEGNALKQSKIKGTMMLRQLVLTQGTDASHEFNVRYETEVYNNEEFSKLHSTQIIDDLQDKGVDSDNNGQYDYIEFEVPLLTYVEGYYNIELELENSGITQMENKEWYLDEGKSKITLRLDGEELYDLQQNGPYTATISITRNGIREERDYETASYNYNDFEHETTGGGSTNNGGGSGRGYTLRSNNTSTVETIFLT